MTPWLSLVGAVFALLVLHLATMAVVSRWVGLEPTVVHFGFGPALARRTLGGVALSIHAFPLGGSVENAKVEEARLPRPAAPSFVASSLLLLIGIAALGPGEGVAFAGTVVSAVFRGAISPAGDAQAIIAAGIAAIEAGPAVTIAARAAVAMAMFNLLLVTWVPLLRNNSTLVVLGAVLPLVVSAPWLFAWAVYLL
ncbi:MAG: hypothetical protein AAF721_21455 [Myxococcota bacterium]